MPMTLQDLIDDLSNLHPSSRTASVEVASGDTILEVLSARYEDGVCTIECEAMPDTLLPEKDDEEDD